MTQEEKAKAYDDAREKIAVRFGINVAEEIFSEFEDSEDERIRKEIIQSIKGDMVVIHKDECIAWLENIPYTIDHEKREGFHLGYKAGLEKQGREKPAWSYEDEANLNNIIWLCNNCIKGSETTWIPSQATKIKHLIETIKEKGLVQQNPAWSEEDEHRVKDTIYFLDTAKKHYASTVELDACINWLKSLKQRIGGEL